MLFDEFAQALADGDCTFEVGITQQHGEFFAAVTRYEIAGTCMFGQ